MQATLFRVELRPIHLKASSYGAGGSALFPKSWYNCYLFWLISLSVQPCGQARQRWASNFFSMQTSGQKAVISMSLADWQNGVLGILIWIYSPNLTKNMPEPGIWCDESNIECMRFPFSLFHLYHLISGECVKSCKISFKFIIEIILNIS